jgi:microcystin degradation protein MlrC
MPRLAVSRLWLEVNSFSPLPTGLDDFTAKEWLKGTEALARFAGTPTELGAVEDFARARPDWQVEVLRCAAADPGGPMEEALFTQFLAELDRDLRDGHWDAVYLSLHGALATAGRPTPDLDIVRTVRAAAGAVPLGVSLDMHANIAPELVSQIDVLTGYKTLPHVDMKETAARALELLALTAEGRLRPRCVIVRPGIILHSHNMATAAGPMRQLEDLAALLTVAPVLDVTPFGGFPWTDSPFTGACVTAVADADEAAAQDTAVRVAAEMRRLAPAFTVKRPDAAAGIAEALGQGPGTVVVQEPADNTYSGGIADTSGLFRALVQRAPPEPSVFAYFYDPPLVASCIEAGIGAELDVVLGGRIAPEFGAGVRVKARVERLTDGVFVNYGPMFAGVRNEMGRSAVLKVGQIAVIVTERRQPVNDLAYLELHGIDIAAVRLFCVKAKNHFRAAFGPLCRAIIEVETPGPAAIDLSALPYRYADPGLLS